MLLRPVPPRSGSLLAVPAALCLLAVGLLAAPAVAHTPPSVDSVAARLNTRTAGDGFDLPVGPVVLTTPESLRTDAVPFLRRGLATRADWAELVEGALAESGLPPELAAVPLVESGYTNWGAPGDVRAGSLAPGIAGRGLWMFIPATARRYGLRVDDTVDQRLDPVLATTAAVALLSDLYARFDNWLLALAAYNQGGRAVEAAIEAQGTRDALLLTERGALNDYVPKVLVGALLLEDPTLLDR